jgi:hypothetical protein
MSALEGLSVHDNAHSPAVQGALGRLLAHTVTLMVNLLAQLVALTAFGASSCSGS